MFRFMLSEAAKIANAIVLGKERITDEQYIMKEINHFKKKKENI